MKVVEVHQGIVFGELDRRELGAFDRLLEKLDSSTFAPGREVPFLRAVAGRARSVEGELRDVIALLRAVKTHRGPKVAVLQLQRLDSGSLAPTPVAYPSGDSQSPMELDVPRAALISLAGWYPYGFTTQQRGSIHNDVIAVPEAEGVRNHSGSQVLDLAMHTEDASFNLGPGRDISPDFLALHHLRNPNAVPTVVAIPDWGQLSSSTLSLLREPWFVNRTAPLQGGSENDPTAAASVLYGPAEEPWFRINVGGIESDRYAARRRAALLEFCRHLQRRTIELPSQPGQVAFIDNRRVAHGRPAFTAARPRYDGSGRWQRRVVVSDVASRIAAYESSPHVVDPDRLLKPPADGRSSER
jgi:L-asparagine oxygenase